MYQDDDDDDDSDEDYDKWEACPISWEKTSDV